GGAARTSDRLSGRPPAEFGKRYQLITPLPAWVERHWAAARRSHPADRSNTAGPSLAVAPGADQALSSDPWRRRRDRAQPGGPGCPAAPRAVTSVPMRVIPRLDDATALRGSGSTGGPSTTSHGSSRTSSGGQRSEVAAPVEVGAGPQARAA